MNAHKRNRRMLATAIITLGMLTTACAGGTSKDNASTPDGKPVSGGTLTVGRTADIFTFDPFNTQDDRSIFTEMEIYNRLVKLGPNNEIQPELATSWKASSDALSMTFTLRDNVKFSDGSPLTAEDVVYSLNRDIDQKGSWGFLFSPVKEVSKVADNQVKITMTETFAPVLPSLSTFAASIYSKANAEKFGDKVGSNPLGTGAFSVEKWDKGSQLVLKKNPHYWEKGKPYLDKVIFKVVGDENARMLRLRAGEVDLLDVVPSDQVSTLKSNGNTITQVNGSAVAWAVLNQKNSALKDPKVRLALAWAMDRQSIANTVYFKLASPATSILPSSSLFYSDDTSPAGYDLAKAKQYLSESSMPDGFTLDVTVPAGDATAAGTAQIWAASLKKIGITLKTKQVEATTAQEEYNTEKYTIRLSAWTNDTPDPDELMGVGMDYTPQNSLHTSYRSEEAKRLVLQGRGELNEDKRAAIYKKLQTVANQDMPYIPIVSVPRIYASTKSVIGFSPNSQGKYDFANVYKTK